MRGGEAGLRMEGSSTPTSSPEPPMTSSTVEVSPLRRRMIEDMLRPQVQREDAARLYPPHRAICQVSGPLAGHRNRRGPAPLSGSSDRDRHSAPDREQLGGSAGLPFPA